MNPEIRDFVHALLKSRDLNPDILAGICSKSPNPLAKALVITGYASADAVLTKHSYVTHHYVLKPDLDSTYCFVLRPSRDTSVELLHDKPNSFPPGWTIYPPYGIA